MKPSFSAAAAVPVVFTMLFALFVGSFSVPVNLRAQEPEKEERSPVEEEMKKIQRNVRRLNRQQADPAMKEASLELVAAMQKSADVLKTLAPSRPRQVPEAEFAKWTETYKQEIDKLIGELAVLKAAVEAGEAEATKASLSKINTLKNSGHKALNLGDDR